MARKNALLDVVKDAYVRGMARNVNALAEIAGKPFPDPRVYARGAEFVPGVGDAVGLGQDVRGYAENPSSLTPWAGLGSLAALIPAVPRLPWDEIIKRQRMAEGLKAAVKDPVTGRVYTGWTHQGAIDFAGKTGDDGIWSRLWNEWDASTDNVGFVDKSGKFLSRSEADATIGIQTMEDRKDLLSGKNLDRLFK